MTATRPSVLGKASSQSCRSMITYRMKKRMIPTDRCLTSGLMTAMVTTSRTGLVIIAPRLENLSLGRSSQQYYGSQVRIVRKLVNPGP